MRLLVMAAASLLLVGCALDPLVLPEGSAYCPEDRRLPDGACCPAWTIVAHRTCEERPFVLPSAEERWGSASEGGLRVALDAEGLAVVVHETQAGVELLEERLLHEFNTRDLGGILAGGRAPALAVGQDRTVAIAWVSPAGLQALVRPRSVDWDPLQIESISLSPAVGAPSLAMTPEGELLLAWTQNTAGGPSVFVARRSPSGDWSLPDLANDVLSAGPSNGAMVSAGPSGQALVAWREGGAVIARERRAYGEAFGPPITLSPFDGDALDEPPSIAVGPTGEVAAAFRLGKGPLFLATRPRDGAWILPQTPFSPPDEIITYPPAIAFGPLGELYVAWAEEGGLHAARRAASGLWIEDGTRAALADLDHLVTGAPVLGAGPEGGVLIAAPTSSGVVARRAKGLNVPWDPPSLLSASSSGGGAGPAAAIGLHDRAIVGFAAQNKLAFAFIE